ncbi:MAG TPA: DNA translocase FtsK [Solirubrobacteraceae bacterium]|jgi:S-DNA-T family DNA segregation ATPase FtsK/SpoIIIE|nr:DNA translocase FtsK [Solirubrobacteraceae bacterium]
MRRVSRDALARLWPAPLSQLDQRQLDMLGFATIAVGVFMGFVLYGGWNGGRVGQALAQALGWCVGEARVFAPIALVAGGGALLARPAWPQLRPLRAGATCLAAAVTMALAAGTLGVSSSASPNTGESSWSGVFVQAHGGVLGEALYQLTHRLVQNVGVDLLIAVLLFVGVTSLTGASPAGVLRAAAGRAAGAAKIGIGRLRAWVRARRAMAGDDGAAGGAGEGFPLTPPAAGYGPPEPAPEELIVRATHVEAPSRDGIDPDAEDHAIGALPAEGGEIAAARTARATGAGSELAGGVNENPEEEAIPGVAHADPGADPAALTPQGRYRDSVTEDPDFAWEMPDAGRLLTRSTGEQSRPDTAGQERTATSLVEALGHFGVQAKVIGTVAGPHITRYELRLAPGTKVAKVAQLKDDLAYALAATDIRILAPIPGKQAVGVEVPNARRRIVRLGDVFQQPPRDWSPLTVWLGKDVAGKAIGADLAKMPHLLVAGTTGAGKSGAINAMLSSVLLRASPHELRLVLVDPKQVELNHYESIPHLLTPVITSPRMAANALQNLVKEMEQRYGIMSLARTRSLIELNKARAKREEAPLPYILCVIDELADLMMVAPADVEDSIIRLAQKARAVGIHLVLATQSPRVDVITGMIKANVPSRIAFAVSSQTDSRVILDQNGAESLLGQGDMLFSPVGSSRLQRIQGAYIDEGQIAKLTELWRKQGEPELREELLQEVEPSEPEGSSDEFDPDEDPLLRDAIALVAEMGTASTSMLQRRLRLGYTRAGRLIDMLERRGVISGYEGSKPRQVLVSEADLPRVLASLEGPGARAQSETSIPG